MSFSVLSQNKNSTLQIDSLIYQTGLMDDDTNKVKQLALISYKYSLINPEKGIAYGFQASNLAKQLKWEKGTANAHVDIAINLTAISKKDDAIRHYDSALTIYQKLRDNNGVASIKANMGIVYKSNGDYVKALSSFFKALEIIVEIKDQKLEAIVCENIGTVYFEQKVFSKTKIYYSRAITIYKKLNNKEGIARSSGNMGLIYDAQKEYIKALESHFLALKMNKELGHKSSVQINLANIGYVYSKKKNYYKALDYQMSAMALSKELKNKQSLAIDLGNIGETYFLIATDTLFRVSKSYNINQAIEYLTEAVTNCEELNLLGPLSEYYYYLSNAYLLNDQYPKSVILYNKHRAVADSLFSSEYMLKLQGIETAHERGMKSMELELSSNLVKMAKLEKANQKRGIIILVISLILTLIIFGLVIRKYRWYIKTQKSVLSEIAYMQSHNVRGPLSRILGLIQLYNLENIGDPTNKIIMEHIYNSANEIDEIIHHIVSKTHIQKTPEKLRK